MPAHHDASNRGADDDAAGGLGAGIEVGPHMQVLADDHADVVEDAGQAGLGEGQGIDEHEQAQDELAWPQCMELKIRMRIKDICDPCMS